MGRGARNARNRKRKEKLKKESDDMKAVRLKIRKGIYPRRLLVEQSGFTRDDKGKTAKSKVRDDKGDMNLNFVSTFDWFKKYEE